MLIGALDPVLHYRNLQKSNICFLQNVGATRPSELLVDRCSRYKRKAMWKGGLLCARGKRQCEIGCRKSNSLICLTKNKKEQYYCSFLFSLYKIELSLFLITLGAIAVLPITSITILTIAIATITSIIAIAIVVTIFAFGHIHSVQYDAQILQLVLGV